MELSRSERELSKPINWGEVFFKKLQERETIIENERKTLKSTSISFSKNNFTSSFRPPKAVVRDALDRFPVETGPLDATSIVGELSEDDLCDFFSRFPKCEIFYLKRWEYLSLKILRSIAISFSENLIELDLSDSNVSSSHIDILLVGAINLKIIKLNNCNNVDSITMCNLVKLVNKSLSELYLKNCAHMKSDPLQYIGGSFGVNGQSLRQLRCLDLSECPLIDKGVLSFATPSGCPKLQYINLENCHDITDVAIIAIAKSCIKLELINLSGCYKITNKSITAIGKNCHKLISINLSRCSIVTDKGIKSIANGCPNLQAANFAGMVNVTEETMYFLATKCEGLLMLNLTGCEKITVNGLDNLIRGLHYIEKGVTFMGFKPTDEHVAKKLDGHLKMIQQNTLNILRKEQLEREEREEKVRAERELILNTSSSIISSYMYRYKLRMYFYRLWRKRIRGHSALMIQRTFRGSLGRIRSNNVREQRRQFYALSPYALKIQSRVRAYLSILKNKKVAQTIREMYFVRRQEVENSLAVRLQCHARHFLARLRVKAIKELKIRRTLNMHHAIILLQRFSRMFISKMRVYNLRIFNKNYADARYNAGLKIKSFLVEGFRRYKSKLSGDALRIFWREKWVLCIVIQKFYRGHKARERVRKMQIFIAALHYAATAIQRVFRGSRILHWKDMRLNVIAAFVLDRQYIERKGSVEASRLRYKQYIDENRCDSASEPDDDDADDDIWVKSFDAKKKMNYWQNFSTNEITYDEPPENLAHEKDMVNKRVKVFWTVQNNWYDGYISRYHRRKKRHRVEYDDGDHEWINLEQECDRVQVQLDDGTYSMYLMYHSEAKINERRKVLEKQEREDFKKQAYADAMQWKMFRDDKSDEIMFISQYNGQLRTGLPNAADWVIQDDGFGFPCFFNVMTDQVAYEDPRFVFDVEKDVLAQRKYIMQEVRYALYFCKDYLEEFQRANTLNDRNQIRLIMLKVRNSPKVNHLNSFIIRAKALYQPISVIDKPMDEKIFEELEYASYISERMAFICNQAETFVRDREDNKLKIVDKLTEKSGQIVYCRYCERQTIKHVEFCPTCGKRQVFF